MHLNKNHTFSRRALAMLLTLTLCLSLVPSAFAAQQNSYHDPAEHWMQASNRTNELDVNSVVTRETFKCGECGKVTSFEVFRVPEYLRDEKDALKLVNTLIQATTPKGSHESDPFWSKSETALLQAIILMLFQEAPEYEQNFSMVLRVLEYRPAPQFNHHSAKEDKYERIDLHPLRGLLHPRPETFRAAGGPHRQVWPYAATLPEGTPARPLQQLDFERKAVLTPVGD